MLNDAKIKAAKPKDKPYRLADSEQLYLYVSTAGGKLWRMNYTFGRSVKDPKKPAQKTLAFGAYPAVTLVDARKRRDEAKAVLAAGRDPAVERKLLDRARQAASGNTFRLVAERWFELKSGWSLKRMRESIAKRDTMDLRFVAEWTDRKGGWVAKHSKRVWESLEKDVFGAIGSLPIDEIDAPRLLELLSTVEGRDAIETAHRLRQRISAVFVYGIAAGIASGDPSASLGKALKPKPRIIPQPSVIDKMRTYDERVTAIRQLMIDCEARRARATTKFAMRLLALTAVRPGELQNARWCEFEDLEPRYGVRAGQRAQINQPLWRIPAARMKGDEDRKNEVGGDHLVPLAPAAVELLAALRTLSGDLDLLFPSERHVHRPISDNTLRQLLIDAGYYQIHVPHGFRSAFSTIMNERAQTAGVQADRAIIDLMLAHTPKDKVESAYNRAQFMPRRRELAEEWAELLLGGMWPAATQLGRPMR